MDFRAVCPSWRSVTDDPRADGTDPRFHPKKWAMLSNTDEPNGDVIVSFVNLGTGRFLSKNIPQLSKYILIAATDGGLLVLGELEAPHGVRVLNPFTGSVVARFSVPILGYDVRKAVVTVSPTTMLFISGMHNNFVAWADLNSIGFNEFWVMFPEDLRCMTHFAGDVYVTNRHGSIISSLAVAAAGQDRSAGTITMTTVIPASPKKAGVSFYYFLVESEGDLLLVSFRCTFAGAILEAVHKVDTVRKLLEPVDSIGSRAIFVSSIRSISVDANMSPTIEAGCVYFVEPILSVTNELRTAVSAHCLGCQSHDAILVWNEGTSLQFGPSTLVQVLGDYCMSIQPVD